MGQSIGKMEGLQTLQLQHWVRPVKAGNAPPAKDPITGVVTKSSLPLARSDGGGLTFTLSKAGMATWVMRYRAAGRARELTIENFPDIGLADARKISREKRAEVDRAGDPAADKRQVKALALKDWTVRQFVEDYRAKILYGLGESTQKGYGRSLKRIEDRLGSLIASKITSLDIVELIEHSAVPWNESRMLLTTARMVFKHAAGRRLVSPGQSLRRHRA